MFAKGPRFPPNKPSDVPGPGFYKFPDQFRSEAYKKGAFLDKADRFSNENSDVPGPGTYNVDSKESNPHPVPSKAQKPGQALTHLQNQVEALKAQNARILKEHQQTIKKYEDKVVHNESTIKSLVKDNVALQSQLSTQQKEYRSACQRETSLRSALEKAEGSAKYEAEKGGKLMGLQRKLLELEKAQADDRKQHQTQVEHLKTELEASHKVFAEQNEREAALRKQEDISNSRIQDLKKAILADQSELKELRMRLRDADQAQNRMVFHQGEVQELRKTLQKLEAQHKSELQSRHSTLSQQDKALESERRRRGALEQQIENLKAKADIEVKEARNHSHHLQQELDSSRRSVDEALCTAAEERQRFTAVQTNIERIVQEYGRLAASSTSLDMYKQSETLCASLRLRNIRLERRLADRDALIEQLTSYCRQVTEEKHLLARLLQEVEDDQRAILSNGALGDASNLDGDSLTYSFIDASDCAHQEYNRILQSDLHFARTLGCFYRAQFDDLMIAYTVANRETAVQSAVTDRLIERCAGLQEKVDAFRENYDVAEAELSRKVIQVAKALAQEQMLTDQLVNQRQDIEELTSALNKERETSGRLVQALHQSQVNEDHLRSELDELKENLSDLTRYKEAHADLLSEVVDLIQRNELAEAEADRLSKFNAEILGHTNPQQKIFYIDRIRRELADTKHQLLKSTRAREDLAADNEALQHEVAAYKSIAVPDEQKTRGSRVRINRAPLVPRRVNGIADSITVDMMPMPQEVAIIDMSPMTLDEIT